MLTSDQWGLDRPQAASFQVETDDGAVLKGEKLGRGPTVVLVHCWTGNRATWGNVPDLLAQRGYEVIAWDQRGHGQSSSGRDPVSMDRLTADFDTVLDQLSVDSVIAAGHSMGGSVLLHRASQNDERLTGLVLVSTTARLVAKPLRRVAIKAAGWFQTGVGISVNQRCGARVARLTFGRWPAPDALALTNASVQIMDPAEVTSHIRALLNFDGLKGLTSVAIPSVIMVGSLDRLTPPRQAMALHRNLQTSRLVRLTAAGHMLPFERPWAVVNEIDALSTEVKGGTAIGGTLRDPR